MISSLIRAKRNKKSRSKTMKKSSYNSVINYQNDELALQYMPAVKAMAYRLKERLPAFIELSDLISIGTEELIKTSRRYDASINDSFWGFARIRINGAMLDYLRSLDTISKMNRRLVKQVESEISKYYNKHQEEPDIEYLASVIGESVEKIQKAMLASEICTTIPLDDMNDTMLANGSSTLEGIVQEELIDSINEIIATLSEREQIIMQLYYYEELSLSEISKILNITESRISQINKEVIRKLRAKIGEDDG